MLRAGNKCYRVLNASANFSSAIDLCRELLVGPKKKAFVTSLTDVYENGTCARGCVCDCCIDSAPRLCSQRSS